MNRADIIEIVSNATGLSQVEVSAVFQGILSTISSELKKGGYIELRRFGTFKCVQRAERKAANPRTGELVMIPERVMPVFKPSPILREAVKNIRL